MASPKPVPAMLSEHSFIADQGAHLLYPLASQHQKPAYQLKTERWTGSTDTKRQNQ